MIRDKCIVCTPLTTWDNAFTNTMVKMMSILSKENSVLFVDYQYTFKDVFSTLRGMKKTPLKRIFGLESRLRKIVTSYGSEIGVLTPPAVWPVNWIKEESYYRYMLGVNASIIKSSVKNAICDMSMKDIIVVNGYNPFLGLPLFGQLNEALNVYYCYDEIEGDVWYHNHGPQIEKEYIGKTDVVITTSDGLYDSKYSYNSNCYVVKNGVDFDLFHMPINNERNNIIGYTGSIDERFDIDTMSYVISNLSEYSFEFVGRITNENAGNILGSFPNVKLHGAKKPEEIPGFMKNMDLCIIPYLKNDLTKGVYPLKINEYLAAGKPVVMTDFATLHDLENIVSVAKTKEDFVQNILQQINSDDNGKKMQRIEVAKMNSWENKVEEFSNIIEKCLVNKTKALV